MTVPFWYGEKGLIKGSNFTSNRANGTAPGTYGDSGMGGAVIWTGSHGLVDDCIFEENHAANSGGAVYLRDLDSGNCDNTTFSNSKFFNNTAGVNGGAIEWNKGATNGKIENSVFEDNSAKANGGAVFWYGEKGTIQSSNFTGNRANGTAQGTYGNSGCGGAIIWTGSDGTVDDSIFENNSAADSGGAVYLHSIGTTQCRKTAFTNSKFFNNTAVNDGGAIDWGEGAVNGRIASSTFDNNSAGKNGGAVSWTGHVGRITDSNFTYNTADKGGAVSWSGISGTISGSRFISNNATNGGAIYLQNCTHDEYISVTITD